MKWVDKIKNLFKRDKYKKLTWDDVTVRQFLRFEECPSDDFDKMLFFAELLLGEEVLDLPELEFYELFYSKLAFLKNDVPTDVSIPKKIKLNDKVYCLNFNLADTNPKQQKDMLKYVYKDTTAQQYQDYISLGRTDDDNLAKVLSIFVIPEGHKYLDGYAVDDIVEDIKEIPITVALSASSFFKRQFELYMMATLRCLNKETKKLTRTLKRKRKKKAMK